MGQVISATTRFAGMQRAREQRGCERYLRFAHQLIGDARANEHAGDYDLALESAYQAALRVAGARIVSSAKLARRKRLPTSAWERLALIDADGARWAKTLSAYSRVRSRVASGIDPEPAPELVREVIAHATQFLADVEASVTMGEAA